MTGMSQLNWNSFAIWKEKHHSLFSCLLPHHAHTATKMMCVRSTCHKFNSHKLHGVVYHIYIYISVKKNNVIKGYGGSCYLVCSRDPRRSLRGFHWMNCNHCGTSGGCGPGLREEKHHQPHLWKLLKNKACSSQTKRLWNEKMNQTFMHIRQLGLLFVCVGCSSEAIYSSASHNTFTSCISFHEAWTTWTEKLLFSFCSPRFKSHSDWWQPQTSGLRHTKQVLVMLLVNTPNERQM